MAEASSESTLPGSIITSGVGLMFTGLSWGWFVGSTPFPRLALGAHMQFMAEGAMATVVGLVLNSPISTISTTTTATNSNRLKIQDSKPKPKLLVDILNGWQKNVVYWGIFGIWPTLFSEIANAYWGTHRSLSLAYKQANTQAIAEHWQEIIVATSHLVGGLAIFASVGVVLYACCKVRFGPERDSE